MLLTVSFIFLFLYDERRRSRSQQFVRTEKGLCFHKDLSDQFLTIHS